MDAARLIVCERTGFWAAALDRALPDRLVRLRQTRSLRQCSEELLLAPASFLALELTAANVGELATFLGDLGWQFPLACPVVLAHGTLDRYQWLVREAGAVHFVASPRHLAPLAALVHRHMSRLPERRQSTTERIWAALPWSE